MISKGSRKKKSEQKPKKQSLSIVKYIPPDQEAFSSPSVKSKTSKISKKKWSTWTIPSAGFSRNSDLDLTLQKLKSSHLQRLQTILSTYSEEPVHEQTVEFESFTSDHLHI